LNKASCPCIIQRICVIPDSIWVDRTCTTSRNL